MIFFPHLCGRKITDYDFPPPFMWAENENASQTMIRFSSPIYVGGK